ncbi:uncharacterized protein FMAN_09788 [Fusarium mangiferae]|uniref:Uncharacterized protein n=1 Tax=Fusarium mangiferae TaxID=192010 RepID=A0A1L7TNX3_FUSMA|nr:uncharacterized protein FMAN_09788 [Fusarium mangiferae]CVL00284.1 uncharacterized protein FMAN_09788 [Fusarium mangiferae]
MLTLVPHITRGVLSPGVATSPISYAFAADASATSV